MRRGEIVGPNMNKCESSPQRNILFFVTEMDAEVSSRGNDNALRLPRAFANQGWSVQIRPHASLHLQRGSLFAEELDLANQQLIWPIGFGPRAGFLDRAQLLSNLPQEKLITPISELVLQHGKASWLDHCSETFIHCDPAVLSSFVKGPGQWVLKPLAGSYGRGVALLGDQPREQIEAAMAKDPGSYFMVQRYLAEVEAGEKRTLVAGGAVIGTYMRLPRNGLHANLSQQAALAQATLSQSEQNLVSTLQDQLIRRRIGFAAIDTVGDTLVEVNIANPGGFGTLDDLYQRDHAQALVGALTRFAEIR
jgi:hypothetical protein